MPGTDPIEIKFLINSPEVAAAAEKVKQSVAGVTASAKDQTSQMGALYDALLKKISASLDQTFGADKVSALNQQLQSVEGEAQQLATIFGFVKDNIANLKLNPTASADLVAQIDQVTASLNDVNADLEETGKAAGLTFATIVEDMQKAQTESANLLTQLREIRYAIAGAIATKGEGSPEVLQLTQQAAQLEQRLKNAQNQVKLFASNTSGIDALKQGFTGLLGGATAVISTFSLFSDDSDELQKTMVKLFAVMQAVTGAEQFMSVVNKNSAVTQYILAQYRKLTAVNTAEQTAATEALSVAQGVQTAATEGTTAAMTALDIAMDANPVGLVIAAVAALAAGLVVLASNTRDQIEIQKEFSDALAETNALLVNIVESYGEIYHQHTEDAKNAVSMAQAEGKSQADILTLKQKALEAEKLEAEQKLAGLGFSATQTKTQQDQVKALQDQNEAITEQIRGLESIPDKQRLDYQNKQLAALQSQQKAIEAILNPAQKYVDILKGNDQGLQENAAAQAAAQKEAALRSAQGVADARLQVAKKGSEEELNARIAAINAARNTELSDVNKTAGERTDINAKANKQIADAKRDFLNAQLSDQESYAKASLSLAEKGSTDEFNAKVAMITLEAQREENQAGVTAAKVIEINAAAEKQISDLRKEYNYESNQEEIETAKATTEAKLAEVQRGSSEELSLKKQLADDQAKLDINSAQKSISNQTLLAAKIKEIYAKLLSDKKKMDDDAAKAEMDVFFGQTDYNTRNKNIPFGNVLNDSTASPADRANAQLNIDLNNGIGLVQKAQEAYDKFFDAEMRGSNDVEYFRQKYLALNQAIATNQGLIDDDNKAIQANKFKQAADILKNVSQGLSMISQDLEQSNPKLAAMTQIFSELASEGSNLATIFDKSTTKGAKLSAGISGLVDLIGILSSAAAQRKEAEAQFQESLIQQQEEYNKALNNSILLNTQLKNSAFITDYQGEITDGIKALSDATDKYQDALKGLSDAQAIIGEHNAIDWGNVLGAAGAGASIGAAVGSVVPVIGNVVGGVVGGIAGGIAGIFGGKKKKDTLAPILEAYPALIDKSKKGVDAFNDALAQSLIDAKLVKGASADTLQSLIDWKKAVEDAQKQIVQVVQTLAGDLGNNLRDSLVSAFEDGTDAGKAFANSVGQTLQNVLSQLLFNKVFGNAFDQLQKQMEDSFSVGGDQNWQDDLQSFFAQYQGLSQEFDDQLKAAQQQAAAAGIDIFQNPNATDQQQGLAGAISRTITEDTANELSGIMRGQYDTIKRQFSVLSESLAVQQQIQVNTANTVTRLDSAVTELKKISTNTKPSQSARDLGTH